MWKLIKMDFYRLFSSKALRVGALIACLMCAGYILFSVGIIALYQFAINEDPATAMQIGSLLPQGAWLEGVDLAEIVFGGTAILSLFIGCMVSANFIGAEQSCGYTKNFAGQLPDKGYMAVSKLAVTSLVQALILFVYVFVTSGLACLMLGKYIDGFSIGTLLAALGLRLMLHLAINAIIVFLCTLTKSHAIAMVAGCIFGIGITYIGYMAIGMLFGILKIDFDIVNYMPDGINSQLSLNTVGDLSVKAITVSIAFIAVFFAANYLVMRKRDVK